MIYHHLTTRILQAPDGLNFDIAATSQWWNISRAKIHSPIANSLENVVLTDRNRLTLWPKPAPERWWTLYWLALFHQNTPRHLSIDGRYPAGLPRPTWLAKACLLQYIQMTMHIVYTSLCFVVLINMYKIIGLPSVDEVILNDMSKRISCIW